MACRPVMAQAIVRMPPQLLSAFAQNNRTIIALLYPTGKKWTPSPHPSPAMIQQQQQQHRQQWRNPRQTFSTIILWPRTWIISLHWSNRKSRIIITIIITRQRIRTARQRRWRQQQRRPTWHERNSSPNTIRFCKWHRMISIIFMNNFV